MTEEQKTAKGLIELFGYQGALSHVKFVLSPEFGLTKAHLQQFWLRVQLQIHVCFLDSIPRETMLGFV